MAVGIQSIWESRATATAANVNGSGFNPESATLVLTDLIATAASGQSATPTVSSATYTFVAGDVNAYLFIQSGTTFVPGWYLITGVAAGVATLSAAIGAAVVYTSGGLRRIDLNTANGCATAASPTAGVFTIDYSQQDAAEVVITDGISTASTTFNSLLSTFTQAMIGNFLHLNSGTGTPTVGWYEITGFTDANNIVLDRASGTYTAAACRIGGAASLSSSAGATDDSYFENGAGTNGSGSHWFFIKAGTYAAMGSIATTATGGTQTLIKVIGYNALRTEGFTLDLGANRPFLQFAANNMNWGTAWFLKNLNIQGTPATLLANGVIFQAKWCKIVNNSTTTGRFVCNSDNGEIPRYIGCELACYRGSIATTISSAANLQFESCYLHHSVNGLVSTQAAASLIATNNIAEGISDTAFEMTGAWTNNESIFSNNTVYGAETPLGAGFTFVTGFSALMMHLNNIYYGLVTAINNTDTTTSLVSDYNVYFNNTNPNVNFPIGKNDLAINPNFAGFSYRSGSTATTVAGNNLVQAGATFVTWGITPGVDFVYLDAGTGTTNDVYYSILSVTNETTLVVGETLTANATADHVWHITQGHNFAVGNSLVKGKGYPGIFPGGLTTGYMTAGAAQAQSGTGTTSPKFIIGG